MTIDIEAEARKLLSKAMRLRNEQGHGQEVRGLFVQALEMAQRSPNLMLRSYILGNWGVFELSQNELHAAETLLLSAIRLDQETEHPISLGIDLANLGTVYGFAGNYAVAQSTLNEALRIQLQNFQWDAVYRDLANLIQVCMCLDKPEKAIAYLTQAVDVFGKIGDIEKVEKLQQLFKDMWPSVSVPEPKFIGLAALFQNVKKIRSFEACESVRLAIHELANKDRSWRVNLQVAQGLRYAAADLMQLAFDIGNKHYTDGDSTKAQEFWTTALSASNDLRSQQLGVKRMMGGSIGANVSHRWPKSNEIPFVAMEKGSSSLASRRGIRCGYSDLYSQWVPYRPKDVGEVLPQKERYVINPARPSFDNFIAVTYSFMKDDLVVFVDTQLNKFTYGDDFRDYGYTPDKVLPSPFACPPIRRINARQQITEAIQNLYDNKKELEFAATLKSLSNLLAIPDINKAISDWCQQKGLAYNDMQVIFIPEGILHRVPFGFLRAFDDNKSQLFNQFASVTTALSPLVLKWQIYAYIYRCLPFIEGVIPRCIFFGAPQSEFYPNTPYLSGVLEEWKLISNIFGSDRVLGFGDVSDSQLQASIDNLVTYHHDGEVFWYAGHGVAENQMFVDETGLESRPIMSLALPHQLLTLESFYRGEPWNFSRNWMVVLNSCFLGRLSDKGTEVEGFLSALYLVGANAVVSCLWPVNDEIAPVFAKEFCERLKNAYGNKMLLRNNFVRAKAFTECMRSLIPEWSEKDLACYIYCGAP